MTEEEIRQRNEERRAKLDAVSRRNMEKCAAFIAREKCWLRLKRKSGRQQPNKKKDRRSQTELAGDFFVEVLVDLCYIVIPYRITVAR